MRLMGRNIAGAILRCRSEPTIQIRMENGTKRNKCRRILNSREALTNRILSSMGSSGRRWDRWFTNPTTVAWFSEGLSRKVCYDEDVTLDPLKVLNLGIICLAVVQNAALLRHGQIEQEGTRGSRKESDDLRCGGVFRHRN